MAGPVTLPVELTYYNANNGDALDIDSTTPRLYNTINLWAKESAVKIDECYEMKCMKEAWADWLMCENNHNRSNIALITSSVVSSNWSNLQIYA